MAHRGVEKLLLVEGLTKAGCDPKLARCLVTMWVHEWQNMWSEYEPFVSFLESKFYRLEAEINGKPAMWGRAVVSVKELEANWAKLVLVQILEITLEAD